MSDDGVAPQRQRTVLVVGVLEAASLLALLVNLATVHLAALAQLLGPVHGTLYVAGIALVWSAPYPRRARWLAVVPGVGTWLAAGRRYARRRDDPRRRGDLPRQSRRP